MSCLRTFRNQIFFISQPWCVTLFKEKFSFLCPRHLKLHAVPHVHPSTQTLLFLQNAPSLIVFWIWLCLDNWSMNSTVTLWTASDTFRIILAYSTLCFFSGICQHIQLYSAFLKCIHAFRPLQVYLTPYVTLTYSQPCNIDPWHIEKGGLI